MNAWRSMEYVPEDCKDCSWLNRCNGGCRTSAKVFNGDWNKKDMWCTGKPSTPPHTKKRQFIDLKPETKLRITDNIRIRQEGSDAYLIYNKGNDLYFMVNQVFYDFILELQKRRGFSFGELCNEQNKEQINNACLFLINRKVIKMPK